MSVGRQRCEKPILFSAPMVKALLAGTKTQTRRVISPQPKLTPDLEDVVSAAWDAGFIDVKCPYGKAGDRLYVRETLKLAPGGWRYAADDTPVIIDSSGSDYPASVAWAHHKPGNTCVSIHMPKWAARVWLEVSSVRVQRLQEISGHEALAEGIEILRCGCEACTRSSQMCTADEGEAVQQFWYLWDSINGERAGCSWEANPWVWCVSFKRIDRRTP